MSFVLPTTCIPFIKKPIPVALALFTLGASLQSQAQEPPLEEIIITSQKRPQSLQDVPISVAAVTGDKIERMAVENLEDLTQFVPNIHFTETGIGTQMRIRGVGSDNSQGFEQSVGMYLNGVYHGRAQLFRMPIFDVERVEVMRGPQSTLFGKNSIAGALDIITARPTDELEGKLFASHEMEFSTNELSGVLSGPLSESVNARIAIRSYDDPGYTTNNFKNTTEANQEELTVRTSIDWQASENLSALLIVERDTFDIIGRSSETTLDKPASAASPRFYQVLQNPAFNGGSPGPTFDPQLDYQRDINAPEFSNNTIDTGSLRFDYDWNGYAITALTGYLTFESDENCDCDFTPATIFDLDLYEDYKQSSQEIRIASPNDTTVEWVAGLFYQSYQQNFNDLFNIPVNSLLPTFLSLNPNLPPSAVAALPVLRGAGIARDFEQNSKAWAVFGEATWNISHSFNITLGARFTEEDKDSTKSLNAVDITNNAEPFTGPQGQAAASLFKGLFAVDTEQLKLLGSPTGHDLDLSRSESAFTPSISVGYYLSEDIMTYGKISKGFKAGGFDPRTNSRPNFEFEEETVIAYEAGTKMGLADGQGELNIALFHMDYENLQVSQFDGGIGFNVGNAKAARVRGMELDGRWRLHEYLTSSFGFAFLDFEYTDFQNGNCHYGETPTSTDPGSGADLCDYTGRSGVYTPEYTLNGSLDFSYPLAESMALISSMDMQWVDEQNVHVNQDPLGVIDAYTMLSLRIGIETEHWQIALLGQNLLDEEVISYSGNTPLSESLAGSNTHYSFVRRPRTIALTGRYNF